jgi:hypothetical protein
MANHASTRTTQLYDRRREELSLDEVERIRVQGGWQADRVRHKAAVGGWPRSPPLSTRCGLLVHISKLSGAPLGHAVSAGCALRKI